MGEWNAIAPLSWNVEFQWMREEGPLRERGLNEAHVKKEQGTYPDTRERARMHLNGYRTRIIRSRFPSEDRDQLVPRKEQIVQPRLLR